MPKLVTFNQRMAADAPATGRVLALLATFTHPDVAEPVRLSSDPTVRLSDDPLKYGTVSEGETFEFVLMGSLMPDDGEGAPPDTEIIFEAVNPETVAVLRSIRTRASVDLKVVAADDPDVIEDRYDGFKVVGARSSGDQVQLAISADDGMFYPYPAERMTADRFPGLRR